ncbi:hypothetical protein ACEUZ9_000855 [Paracoccus litorisediminis]|uniref:hypothetical protein n=1 Tax=Paracoccus litorisediminis TaxID=2006130 RepID=UPI003734A5DB
MQEIFADNRAGVLDGDMVIDPQMPAALQNALRAGESCLKCRFFLVQAAGISGTCRRHAPIVYTGRDGSLGSSQAHTRVDGWCGEYERTRHPA